MLESYGFRLAGDVFAAEVGLLKLPGVREVVIPSPVPVVDLARSSELIVFLKPDAAPAGRSQVRAYLSTLRTTREVWLRTQVQAYQVFVAIFPDKSKLVQETAAEALPEIFIVSFVDQGDSDPAMAVLRTMPAVGPPSSLAP